MKRTNLETAMVLLISLIKTNGVLNFIHGVIIALATLDAIGRMLAYGFEASFLGVIVAIVISAFLHIYLGYEICSLRSPKRMAILLVAAAGLAGLSIIFLFVKTLFVIELILSVASLSGISIYKKYKTSIDKEGVASKRVKN